MHQAHSGWHTVTASGTQRLASHPEQEGGSVMMPARQQMRCLSLFGRSVPVCECWPCLLLCQLCRPSSSCTPHRRVPARLRKCQPVSKVCLLCRCQSVNIGPACSCVCSAGRAAAAHRTAECLRATGNASQAADSVCIPCQSVNIGHACSCLDSAGPAAAAPRTAECLRATGNASQAADPVCLLCQCDHWPCLLLCRL